MLMPSSKPISINCTVNKYSKITPKPFWLSSMFSGGSSFSANSSQPTQTFQERMSHKSNMSVSSISVSTGSSGGMKTRIINQDTRHTFAEAFRIK